MRSLQTTRNTDIILNDGASHTAPEYSFGTLRCRVSKSEGRVKSHPSSQSNWDFLWDVLDYRFAAMAFYSQVTEKQSSGMSHVWCANWAPMLPHCWVWGRVHHQCRYWWRIFLPYPDLVMISYHIVNARLIMSQQCALIGNWANHRLGYVRTVVASRPRELLSPLLGPQFNMPIKKLEKEQRRAAKTRRPSTCPRSRDWGSWDCWVWWGGGWRGHLIAADK